MPTFNDALANCAEAITSKFTTAGKFQPEDQLKAPIETFFKEAGDAFKLTIKSVTEAQVDDLGARPDLGIYVDGLLCGHVELKKPGLGANAPKFKGRNKVQWQKFKDLPNLIYTDGNEWALYRNGKEWKKRGLVRLDGDVTADGRQAVSSRNSSDLLPLDSRFFAMETHRAAFPPRIGRDAGSIVPPVAGRCGNIDGRYRVGLFDAGG